jgi:hypothetical protein
LSRYVLCDSISRMPAYSEVRTFLEHAKAKGVSDEALVGVLAARGWPEKEVYRTLAAYYEEITGVEIPSRRGTGTPAKDAFFYLLIFSALATWTIAVGSLAFTLIDRWFTDALFSPGNNGEYAMYGASSSLAAIIVAFPIYLLLSRVIVRDVRSHPEKLNSPVRKWLTYLALVIAACVFVGDLITALTYLLRGEITIRFLSKASIVLLLSGGVFFYYFGALKESEANEEKRGLSRDGWMAAASTIIVAVMVALGFGFTGTPRTQRTQRADSKRVQDLYALSQQIDARWRVNSQKLPEHLDELSGVAMADPVTRAGYEYRSKEGSQYQLCATFALASRQDNQPQPWSHPAGHYCFSVDASQPSASPPFVYSPFGY